MTKLVESLQEWKEIRAKVEKDDVGYVATMGNLHQGHAALLERSVGENNITVMTCFVNPTQFNDEGDFNQYPRTLDADIEVANAAGVDYVFVPDASDLYLDDYRYQVTEKAYSRLMEGAHRPGHFDGVLTVVLKFFSLIRPQRAYFGEKDYQQLQLIKGMVDAFFLDIEIVACPTVRHDTGVALSSRNSRLTEEQFFLSQYIPKYLNSHRNCDEIKSALEDKGFDVEYVTEYEGRRFVAVKLGEVRLIDNVEIPAISENYR